MTTIEITVTRDKNKYKIMITEPVEGSDLPQTRTQLIRADNVIVKFKNED